MGRQNAWSLDAIRERSEGSSEPYRTECKLSVQRKESPGNSQLPIGFCAGFRGSDSCGGTFIQATSLAIYGDSGERINDEYAPSGSGFSVEVCQRWEELIHEIELPAIRRIVLRIGFVLGPGGGALAPLVKLTKSYLGGAFGNGKQYISWIHMDDLNEMFRWSIERPYVQGIYNATSPNPVTNSEFMRELRTALNRPWSPPTPELVVQLGAKLIMRTEPSLALAGRRCIPRRFLRQGFEFRQPDLGQTLRDILA
jgi:uncharacterized protein (TIGR01777 family)